MSKGDEIAVARVEAGQAAQGDGVVASGIKQASRQGLVTPRRCALWERVVF